MFEYKVPRLAFAWILFTQAFLLLPHMVEFPLILIPVWLICTLWRVMIYRDRWRYPSSAIKLLLVVVSCISLFFLQRNWFTVETAILTLLLAFLLKLLEMKQLRDVLIVIYLAYFVIVAELLLSQTLISGLYLITSLLLVTSTLVIIHSAPDEVSTFEPVIQASKILLLSLPIMLVAFLVFPRLEPLWSVPMPAGEGKTGVSGSMSPGLFSQLAKSDKLAFRVRFEGDVPPLKELYWRGVVLTHFDGKTWRPLEEDVFKKPLLEDVDDSVDAALYRYRITMEPSQQIWIFPLVAVTNVSQPVHYLRDFTVKSHDIIDQRISWNFSSYQNALLGKDIYPYHNHSALSLPTGFNPQAIAFANKLFEQSKTPQDYIDKVLAHFRQESFYYTLSPPLLGKHTVDDFLFTTRRGFCEHYASSFVVLMRAVGIPARVVAGYQGGDINPYESHVTVRQLDAHAWAEVWLEDEGWKRIDPTYAVSPERIENGSQDSLQQEEQFLAEAPFSAMHYRSVPWLRNMQYRLDQLNYLWHSWVLDYSGNRQSSVLLALLGSASPQTIALFFASVFGLFSLCLMVYFAWRYRPTSLPMVEKIYRQLLRKMAKKGLKKSEGEGPLDFAQRAKQQWPSLAKDIEVIIGYYLVLNYAELNDSAEESRILKTFKYDVNHLKLR
jgi:transglutaminase-like putative cysteine protease